MSILAARSSGHASAPGLSTGAPSWGACGRACSVGPPCLRVFSVARSVLPGVVFAVFIPSSGRDGAALRRPSRRGLRLWRGVARRPYSARSGDGSGGGPSRNVVKQRRDPRPASVCGTGRAPPNSLTYRGVDTERTARVPRALSCSAESVGPGSVRDAWRRLLLTREGEQSAEAGGGGGREYGRIAGGRRRDGCAPRALTSFCRMGRHCGYAVARTGPNPGAAGLA